MIRRVLIVIPFILLSTVINLHAEIINLSITASMTDAIKEAIVVFSKTHPGITLQPNFASSGSLAKQITQGAPADIYVSANPKWMAYLIDEKMIAAGTDKIFAFNGLVFLSEKASKGVTMETLDTLERIALGSPKSVPAGMYAEQAMENAGVYSKLKESRKLVMAKDVRQALLYADRGEVDGAFVYKTDALLARNAKIAFTVPTDLYDRVSYPIGLTIAGAKKADAKAFCTFMMSQEGASILRRYGFETGN